MNETTQERLREALAGITVPDPIMMGQVERHELDRILCQLAPPFPSSTEAALIGYRCRDGEAAELHALADKYRQEAEEAEEAEEALRDMHKAMSESDVLKSEIETLRRYWAEDWAQDDTEIKEICERHGIETSYPKDFKSMVECVEDLSAKTSQLKDVLEYFVRSPPDFNAEVARDKAMKALNPKGD